MLPRLLLLAKIKASSAETLLLPAVDDLDVDDDDADDAADALILLDDDECLGGDIVVD